MQVSAIRRAIAPLFGFTDDSLRKKQEELYRQPSLREYLPGRRGARSDREGLRATEKATALVTLTAMLGGSRDNIGPEVVRLWEAPCVETGKVPAMDGIKLCGAGLILLLERADLRQHLDRIEVDQITPHVMFIWRGNRLRLTAFAPFASGVEWRRRRAEVLLGGMVRPAQLSGTALSKIADLIAQQ